MISLLVVPFFLILSLFCEVQATTAKTDSDITLTVSTAADAGKIRKNLIASGMRAEQALKLLSALKLQDKSVKQRGATLFIGDDASIQSGNYEVAGEHRLTGDDGASVLYIAEYKNARLFRIDLSDSRILMFEKGNKFTVTEWSGDGQRKYVAYYEGNGELLGSELHLKEIDTTFKYDSRGNLIEESRLALQAGGAGFTYNNIPGQGFCITSKSTSTEECYSSAGRRFFADDIYSVGDRWEVSEFDTSQKIILSIPRIDGAKSQQVILQNITKQYVKVRSLNEGKLLRVITKSSVLGDDLIQITEKGTREEKTGGIIWKPAPTIIFNPDAFCQAAYSKPLTIGVVQAPVQIFLSKPHEGPQWVYKDPDQLISENTLSSNSFKTNDKRTPSGGWNSGAGTVICIRESRTLIGKYSDGQPGYRIDWDVRVVKTSNRSVLAAKKFSGTNPPSRKARNASPAYGLPPEGEFKEWLKKSIVKPIERDKGSTLEERKRRRE